jgi:hypothetical protein
MFEISVEKYSKKNFMKKNIFGQNIAFFKNDDFERFLHAIKNGEYVVK